MSTLREEVSAILKVRIPKDGWDQVFHNLDASGVITQKVSNAIIKLLCKKVEKLEEELEYVAHGLDNPRQGGTEPQSSSVQSVK